MDLMGFMEDGGWRRRSEEFGRKNVISFVWRMNFVCQIHGLREEKGKVTFRMGENGTDIDLVLTKKKH